MTASPTDLKCFACKLLVPRGEIAKTGLRKDGSEWFLCKTCRDDFTKKKGNDRGLVRTGQSWTKMGWNGVPSDRSLRRRSS